LAWGDEDPEKKKVTQTSGGKRGGITWGPKKRDVQVKVVRMTKKQCDFIPGKKKG